MEELEQQWQAPGTFICSQSNYESAKGSDAGCTHGLYG